MWLHARQLNPRLRCLLARVLQQACQQRGLNNGQSTVQRARMRWHGAARLAVQDETAGRLTLTSACSADSVGTTSFSAAKQADL